ncbi:MAG: hypothetical protein ACOYMF_01150 [Bacteroidales bacterium]
MKTAKRALASIWFIIGGILFLVVFLQTLLGHYGDKVNEAWSWLIPMIFPTLSVIIGVFVGDSLGKNDTSLLVDSFIFKLTIALSVVYLLAISLVIFINPLTEFDAITMMKMSNFGLGPLQGIVIAAMAIFFVKKEK